MRVSLIKTTKIIDIILPHNHTGNYWITDFDDNGHEKNLICIEGNKKDWVITSNDEYGYVENNLFKQSVILEEYNLYVFKSKIEDSIILIYCSPIYDNSIKCYNFLEKSEINIGKKPDNDIVYNYNLVNDVHATIKFNKENNTMTITDNKSNMGTFVNNVRISGEVALENGDLIFIMGLKLVVVKMDSGTKLIFNNPRNLVKSAFSPCTINGEDKFLIPETETDDIEIPLYKEEDYFHRTPRFIQTIGEVNLNVDAPPSSPLRQDDMPWILSIGPMLTMSMTSVISAYTAVSNVVNNGYSLSAALPSLVMCGTMFASIFIWPTIMKQYNKEKMEEAEALRQVKYKKYIDDKRKFISDEIVRQTGILKNQYPTMGECQQIILRKMTRLWERNIDDEDFLTINAGIGNKDIEINLKIPEEHFTLVEDSLKSLSDNIIKAPKTMKDVPIAIPLMKHRLLGIIGNRKLRHTFANQVILQLATFHSFENLKIVLLTNVDNSNYWDYVKILPHNWNNDKSFRYFGVSNDDTKEICYNLDKIYKNIKEIKKDKDTKLPVRYVIITDSFNNIRNNDFIKNILNDDIDYGFSLIILDNKITNIPDQCKSFVQLSEVKCEYYKTLINNKPIQFQLDTSNIDYYNCAKIMANIPIKIIDKSEGQLPKKIGFLEMYDVGKIEQLNIKNRWTKNNPIQSLAVPVGVNQAGDPLTIDLHEKYHGPHGLIAGMTGSGKSEFIITYILSLAINFHPYEVQFILIDYKGGGLAGAFENESIGLKLPHLVGTITNLDANEINRSLASIESELKRRQRAFNEAREKTGESTVDIYKYQKMYREGVVSEPVSHLFIISDEFAELKAQQPDFMQQLISAARIGRSLGVHLILATQKPSGVVDPQIWSNTRFRVCLRVQEKSDSNEVIKSPDAALLKQTGRFYFQVGYNEVYLLGQAAWAGAKYVPSEKKKKTVDSSINFINNIGYIYKNSELKKKEVVTEAKGEELINIVRTLSDIAKEENIHCRQLWLPKIPGFITVNKLIEKYKYKKESFIINPVIGEYDNPNMQSQHLLTIPISKKGNVLLYGTAGSGKENFIITMVYSSMLYYLPKELNFYIIDFGSESLRVLKNSPLVGDVIYPDEVDKVKNLYKMIRDEIENRKKLFSEYNGDYLSYCKNSGKTVPNIIVVINNYEAYAEFFGDSFEDTLTGLTRDGSKYGIFFVLAVVTPNGVRFKLKQNFNLNYVLQQNNDDDYSTILGNIRRKYPAKLFGRGIIKIDTFYEFQTAQIAEKDKVQDTIKNISNLLKKKYSDRAPSVPILPEIVDYNAIKDEYGKSIDPIVGISKNELTVERYNLLRSTINIVSSTDDSLLERFIKPFTSQIVGLNQYKVVIIDTSDVFKENEYLEYAQIFDKDYNKVIEILYKDIDNMYSIYKENNYDKSVIKTDKHILCIIVGIDKLMTRLNSENQKTLGKLFTLSNEMESINFVVVDTIDKIKKLEYESWFKDASDTDNGIWLGNGIGDQFTLKVNAKATELRQSVEDEYCYIIRKGKLTLVKYVEKFNLKLDK